MKPYTRTMRTMPARPIKRAEDSIAAGLIAVYFGMLGAIFLIAFLHQ